MWRWYHHCPCFRETHSDQPLPQVSAPVTLASANMETLTPSLDYMLVAEKAERPTYSQRISEQIRKPFKNFIAKKWRLSHVPPGCMWICLMWFRMALPRQEGLEASASKGPTLWEWTYGFILLTIFCYPFWVRTNLEIMSSHCLVQ